MSGMEIKSETPAQYGPLQPSQGHNEMSDDEIVSAALRILSSRVQRSEHIFTDPETVKKYLHIRAHNDMTREVFSVLYLDNKNRLIQHVDEFFGTINACAVYPRVIMQHALNLNASAVILVHNHPSGASKPSNADHSITRKIQDALGHVDIQVLDHFIIPEGNYEEIYSFRERGNL